MTHLRIEQGGTTEHVSTAVISKLYLYAKEIKDYEDDPNNNFSGDSLVSLKGTLSVPKAYKDEVEWLTDANILDVSLKKFPDLHIDVTVGLYIKFVDPEVQRILTAKWGDGIGVTVGDTMTHTSLSGFTSGDYTFYQNTTVTLFPELGLMTSIIDIPSLTFESASNLTSIDLTNIRTIGWNCFHSVGLTVVNLPNIERLGGTGTNNSGSCFQNSRNLTEVHCGQNLTTIRGNVFSGCTGLTTITGLDNVTSLGMGVFRDCTNLSSVTFGNMGNIISLPSSVFYGCNKLVTVTGLTNIISLDNDIFRNCSSLLSTDIDYSKLTSIPSTLFYGCSNLEDTIDLTGISSIGISAFRGCYKVNFIGDLSLDTWGEQNFASDNGLNLSNLSSITINANASVGSKSQAFYKCTLPSTITIGSNVTEIPVAFVSSTTGLLTVSGCSNVSTFGDAAFYDCSNLTSISGLSSSNTITINSASFYNCLNLVFPNPLTITMVSSGITDDKYDTFRNCTELLSVVLTGLDLNLGNGFFAGCSKLTSVSGLDKIKYLSGGAFRDCPLLTGELNFSNVIGASTRNYGNTRPANYSMFYNIGATKIELPLWNYSFSDNWATSSSRAFFSGCPNLTTVLIHIPDNGFPNYRSGGSSVLFSGCPNMTTFIINNLTVPTLKDSSGVVNMTDIGGNNVTLYVPDAIVDDYKTAAGWSNIASNIKGMSELPSS